MLVLAVGFVAQAADIQSITVTMSNVTTNDVTLDTETADIQGEIKMIGISVSNSDPVDIDITDALTGVSIYSADAVAADVTLVPMVAATGPTGADVSFINDTATNVVYVAATCVGVKIEAGDADAGTQDLTIRIIADKNP